MCQTVEKVHVFEKAGLGKAPFMCIGYQSTRDRIALNRNLEVNGKIFTTNMCGGTCDYCGTAIWNVFFIESSDGKEFKVGCDCVLKTGDIGLKNYTNKAIAKAKVINEQKKIQELVFLITIDSITRDLLSKIAHPKIKGKTFLDYAEWMLKNAGTSGKLKVFRLIKNYIGTIDNEKI